MRHEAFAYVDFAKGDVQARNHVVPIREALASRSNGGAFNSYITVYRFPEAYREHCRATGSVKGWDGPCYADYLPFDIDRAGDLTQALRSAVSLANTLQAEYDVRPDQVRYFFSGAKGFHLLVPAALFGEVEPSPLLPRVWKAMALEIAGAAGEAIDRVIYDPNRLFRLPDTQHPSRLWKVELAWEELIRGSAESVREIARRGPRAFDWRPHDLEPVDRLVELYARHMEAAETAPARGPGLLPAGGEGLAADLARTLAAAFEQGQRHTLILAFAGYAAKRHLPRETALGVAEWLLAGAENVVDPDNLPTAVNDTYDRVRQGLQVKGYTELRPLMREADLARLRELLGDTSVAPVVEVEIAPPAEVRIEERGPPAFDVMLGDVLDRMADEKEQPIDATPTPWPAWNRVCGGAGGTEGLARGWHVVVAGKSGKGKSLLGANMAIAAIRAGERAAIVSLEMAQIEMQTRVMAIVAEQRIADLDHGRYFRREAWAAGARALERIHEASGGALYINRRPMNKLSDLAGAIRWLHEHEGVRWFAVDYLQLAAIAGGRASGLLERITEVSFVVRGLAKELEVTTVGMSQLNRETTKLNETPRKEGLYGGAPLENDAEQVLLLDHSRITRTLHGYASWAVLDKNRHGREAEIPTLLNSTTLELRQRLDDEVSDAR